jgi:hypothetical protein
MRAEVLEISCILQHVALGDISEQKVNIWGVSGGIETSYTDSVLEICIEVKMNFVRVTNVDGYAVAQLVEAPRYKPESRGSDYQLAYSFWQRHGRVVDSSSNRNE